MELYVVVLRWSCQVSTLPLVPSLQPSRLDVVLELCFHRIKSGNLGFCCVKSCFRFQVSGCLISASAWKLDVSSLVLSFNSPI